jgi:8-oxo-dGTP pyrophosphatase MutT (NUDIX family)
MQSGLCRSDPGLVSCIMTNITPAALRSVFRLLTGSICSIAPREGFTPAAVLIPLVVSETGVDLLLTRRTEDLETHKGQIAFPGGTVDDGDASRRHTALRETEEELGIGPAHIEVLGILDDLLTPTGFVITPVVGIVKTLPAMKPNPREVAEVFTVPLTFFAESQNARREWLCTPLGEREVWFYEYEGRVIWGATAAMIRNLCDVLQRTEQHL